MSGYLDELLALKLMVLKKRTPAKLTGVWYLQTSRQSIGVLRGKRSANLGDANCGHFQHTFHHFNHIAVDTSSAEFIDFCFGAH